MDQGYSLDDLRLFVLTARHSSLTQASKELDVPMATLSRRLKRLEAQLGCRLFERNAHLFGLTSAGQMYLEQCGPLVADLSQASERLDRHYHSLCGVLRIAAPTNSAQNWLGRCTGAFMQMYPKIRLDLHLSNHNADLAEDRFDLAFRAGEPMQADWVARPVWRSRLRLCAASRYLRQAGVPAHPAELVRHRLIVSNPIRRWSLTHRSSGEVAGVLPEPAITVDDNLVALEFARHGQGIALLPDYNFTGDVAIDGVESVLPDWEGPPRVINMLYRDRDLIPTRLRTFVDFVLQWSAREDSVGSQARA